MRFPETLEGKPCKVCGAEGPENFVLVYQLETCEVTRCRCCGFAFVPPAWRHAISYTSYKSEAVAAEVRRGNNLLKLERHKLRLRFIRRFKLSGRLLDVGSGWGHFLLAARQAGYDVLGIELDEQPWLYSVKDLGLPVLHEDFYSFDSQERFDVITLWDVLEHVDDPRSFLNNCARLQNPGGVLVIQVPQINSLVARMMGKNWKMLGLDHVNYFSPTTLARLLGQCGYEIVAIKPSLELKLLLMYTVYPLWMRWKQKRVKKEIPAIDNAGRQAFFNRLTQRPAWQLRCLIAMHHALYEALSFLRIGEEMMVAARRIGQV
ncbi:MAG: class I SAM-dependent methyltransferase [Flavobacteriales bacterium]|nr:class I SAM-dependent methyltransferase [Flavobacteriales bacterium]MCX7768124.1 class I SAM-dependent methyltransferase [Flavobacteriales bacterium]MDW8409584.1 class I SAM-dependent methyltransferase [Flavobacteriales bacterium]